MSRFLIVFIALTACSNVMALRDDVLVVVNDNSIDSPTLGAYYAEQRGIDPANIVHVRVPDSYFISWDAFRSLRDQLIAFMQANTLDDPALTPVVCADGEPPYYCPAATEQLRLHSKIRYLVTTRGVPTRMVVDGSTLFDAAAPTSVDNYLKYWLINYFAEDTRLIFSEREEAFGDGRGMRTVQPATDRELIVGRIDGLNLTSAKALVDRSLAAERGGLYGRLFGSTRFNRWVDASTGRLIYPPDGMLGWPYQLGLFGEARPECVDYLNFSGALPEGKAPSYCRVQLNEDSDPVSSARYPAPGNAGSRQPRAVDVLLYQGWVDGQAAIGSFDALRNWRKDDQCAVTQCRDAADPAACRAASTDVFGEINSDCVGVAEGFMGYNHQSWPVSYLAVWPTGWFQSTNNSGWNDGGHGDVNQLAFPEVRTDSGFDDSHSLWFRNTDQVADPRCFAGRDFSAPPSRACVDQRRLVLSQRIPLAARTLDTSNPAIYSITFRYKGSNISLPTSLRLRFFVREAGGEQVDYGTIDVATLVVGNSEWLQTGASFQLDPALHSAASYDGIKFSIETAGVYAGALGIDAVSVRQLGAAAGVELAINGDFRDGHRQVATGDHAATFLDRLGGVAFWGSVSHHQSAGCAFCLSGMAPLVYFLRGLPLGDAVWFEASNNSGILYGDPLYSPVAVRLNPVNDTDTVSGTVDLSGSTVNGRDPAQTETSYSVEYCAGDDFRVCDQAPGAWQSTGIRGVGGAENRLLGRWDSSGLVSGSYILRLSVTSLNTLSGRSQTLHDYYPVFVEAGVAPPPATSSVQFIANNLQVAENLGTVQVTVIRSGGSAGAAGVDYATGDGTAVAGSDYVATAGTLSFAEGVTSQSFNVVILDDTGFEGDETFNLMLSNVSGGELGIPASAVVTITEDDPDPGVPPPATSSVQFIANNLRVAENLASVQVTVTRGGDSLGTVSVDYATGDRTAVAGSDYVGTAGTLTFAEGVTSQSFNVTILDDTDFEGDETVDLTLGNVSGGELGIPASAILTITEDDPDPQDSNGDGISDAEAIALGLDPNAPDGDTDGDGIADVIELGGDMTDPLDSDVDGVVDALDPGIATAVPVDGGVSVTIATTAGETLTQVGSAAAIDGPQGINFPFGTVSYTTSSPLGGDVTVRMRFTADLPANLLLFKVDNAGGFIELANAVWTQVDSRTIDITLTDGDPLTDLDGVANGSIDDPVAVGSEAAPVVATDSSGGGGGGCTLTPAADKDLTLPLFFLASLGYLYRRRRHRRSQGV